MTHWKSLIVVVAGLSLLAACGGESATTVDTGQQPLPTWEAFRGAATLDEEDGVLIADGDLTFADESELRAFFDSTVGGPEEGSLGQGLAVKQVNGADVVLNANRRRNITYCVSKATFGANHTRVVNQMNNASADWEAVAGVDFVHAAAEDDNCTNANTNVYFNVRQVTGQSYLASAFFPDYARNQRVLRVDTSSFNTTAPLTLRGILRHELGHVLGMRHEHTRQEAIARNGTRCFEDFNLRGVTAYDTRSVMHYPQCGGTAGWALAISDLDKQGIVKLYPR